jgi:WD40 repeat protein
MAHVDSKGHDNTITMVRFSWDDNFLISASFDGSLKLWDSSLRLRPGEAAQAVLLADENRWVRRRAEVVTMKGHTDRGGIIHFDNPNS